MTDDKGAGEGPYTVSEFVSVWISHGPDGDFPFTDKDGADYDASRLNLAHAAGRKAERERCAKIAEDYALPHDGSWECPSGMVIAKKIRGGQDGK